MKKSFQAKGIVERLNRSGVNFREKIAEAVPK
jgi:hypothetical protein